MVARGASEASEGSDLYDSEPDFDDDILVARKGELQEFIPGEEFGEPKLLVGDGEGEILEVSSEREFGRFRNVLKNKGSWHSCSMTNSKKNKVKMGDWVEYVVLDFGGEGDDIYEIDYCWLRNDHSSVYQLSYKDQHGEWIVYVPWTEVEPYEFITVKKRALAAELKLEVKGSRIWDASWVMIKIYGRPDPITNFMRELKKQLYARDDLEHLRELIKQGGELHLQATEEMKEAMLLRSIMSLREECKVAVMARDLHLLEALMKEARANNMQNDITVLQAGDVLGELIQERDFVQNHPAFKMLRKAEIDNTSATKYLGYLIDCGFECLFGLASLSLKNDNGWSVEDALKNKVAIRSAVHRERIAKIIPRVKLQKQDGRSLVKFLFSIGLQKNDVKRYIQNMWDLKKLNTMFDLLNCDRKELKELGFKEGHIESILMIADGQHSKFPVEDVILTGKL
ncbi:hypothetical protein TrCOL_g8733 [Triparma columacea]|uniref:Uncharacterized protein n=1 Tax=Triparma columacea TaxID=722753 RepID=A0A9W7GIN7_9STRA|nr:hypothetical protein TrCOL_g8733 [Triparma columacea]